MAFYNTFYLEIHLRNLKRILLTNYHQDIYLHSNIFRHINFLHFSTFFLNKEILGNSPLIVQMLCGDLFAAKNAPLRLDRAETTTANTNTYSKDKTANDVRNNSAATNLNTMRADVNCTNITNATQLPTTDAINTKLKRLRDAYIIAGYALTFNEFAELSQIRQSSIKKYNKQSFDIKSPSGNIQQLFNWSKKDDRFLYAQNAILAPIYSGVLYSAKILNFSMCSLEVKSLGNVIFGN